MKKILNEWFKTIDIVHFIKMGIIIIIAFASITECKVTIFPWIFHYICFLLSLLLVGATLLIHAIGGFEEAKLKRFLIMIVICAVKGILISISGFSNSVTVQWIFICSYTVVYFLSNFLIECFSYIFWNLYCKCIRYANLDH